MKGQVDFADSGEKSFQNLMENSFDPRGEAAWRRSKTTVDAAPKVAAWAAKR
jgi:hypothetical protein